MPGTTSAHSTPIIPKAVRGHIFFLTDDPGTCTNPSGSYQYLEDGILVFQESGHIRDVGPAAQMKARYQLEPYELVDYSGKFILPGFIDTHIHYPQTEIIAAFDQQLLQWLDHYAFPAEAQFGDITHARFVSQVFLNELLRNGTTTAAVFCSVHKTSVDALFEEAEKLHMRIIGGKVMMDRNVPAPLRDTPETAYTESKTLIETWHNKRGRILYAVTPRFAVTSSIEQLKAAAQLYHAYSDVYLHTHISENRNEIAQVLRLFPGAQSYLNIYDNFGLVGPRAVFAHGIHLTDEEFTVMAKKGAAIAFCPTSNLFLGNGLFNFKKAQQAHVPLTFGTDIGAGTSFSMLQTMNEAYKVTQLHSANTETPQDESILNPFKAFYMATLGAARALHLDDRLGSFESGKEGDFIVLNPQATPLLKFRMQTAQSLADRLFILMMLADDRVVEAVYLMGRQWKEKP